MLILIAVLLSLIPVAAIIYPFLRNPDPAVVFSDEASTNSELAGRWDTAVAGLKNTELEWTIGNLAKEDYLALRDRYMTDVASVAKLIELEQDQEHQLLGDIENEVQQIRTRMLGERHDRGDVE